jgi:hypothetical protein
LSLRRRVGSHPAHLAALRAATTSFFAAFDALVPARARGHRETSERLFESSLPH